MRVVRQHGSLVSERLAYVSCPSVVAVEAPKVRLARLCPVVACSRRRRSSWRKLNAWIGVIEVRASHPRIPITRTPPEPPCIKSRPLDLKTPSRWAMETPGISESTPLLFSSSVPRPCIRPVINRLLAQSNTTPTADHILAQIPLAHRDLISSYRTAFVLVTLLQIESDTRKQLARDDSLNLWDAWDHHVNAELVVEHCASHVLEVWTGFLRIPRNNANLDALIWTAFPLEEDGSTSVCRMCLTFTSYLDSRKN